MSEERNFEQEAQQEGWRPQEEWKGDPEKWVDAQTFVERGEKISGILKKKVDTLESRLEKAERANKKFGEYHKQTIEKERKEAQRRIELMEEKLAEAITNGDGQEYTRLNRQIEQTKNSLQQQPEQHVEFDDVTENWLAENPWYKTDPVLGTFADGAADRVRAQGFSGKAYYDELTRQVKEAFPEKFGNPNRKRASNVDDGDPVGDKPKGKSYENLPPDAKAACNDFVAQGFMTKEQYVKEYDWDEGE